MIYCSSESGSTELCTIKLERNSRRNKAEAGLSGRSSAYRHQTHSVDRHRPRSPVFFLEPDDWIRTEGSSPIPWSSGPSIRPLDSNSTCMSSVEVARASKPPTGSKQYRRSWSEAPLGNQQRARSITPGPRDPEDRQRKVAIPILCKRNAMMVGSLIEVQPDTDQWQCPSWFWINVKRNKYITVWKRNTFLHNSFSH